MVRAEQTRGPGQAKTRSVIRPFPSILIFKSTFTHIEVLASENSHVVGVFALSLLVQEVGFGRTNLREKPL